MHTATHEQQPMVINGESFVHVIPETRVESLNGYHEFTDLVPADLHAAMEQRDRLVQRLVDSVGVEYEDQAYTLQALFQLENFIVISGAASGTVVKRGPATELISQLIHEFRIAGMSENGGLAAQREEALRALAQSENAKRENLVPQIENHLVTRGREIHSRLSVTHNRGSGEDPYYTHHGLAKLNNNRGLGFQVPFSNRVSAYGAGIGDCSMGYLPQRFLLRAHRYGHLEPELDPAKLDSGVNYLKTGFLQPGNEGHPIVVASGSTALIAGSEFHNPDFLAALYTLHLRNARATTVDLHGLNRDIYFGVAALDTCQKSAILAR